MGRRIEWCIVARGVRLVVYWYIEVFGARCLILAPVSSIALKEQAFRCLSLVLVHFAVHFSIIFSYF